MDRTTDARATAEALRRAAFGPSHGRIQILNTVVPATAYRGALYHPSGGELLSAY